MPCFYSCPHLYPEIFQSWCHSRTGSLSPVGDSLPMYGRCALLEAGSTRPTPVAVRFLSPTFQSGFELIFSFRH